MAPVSVTSKEKIFQQLRADIISRHLKPGQAIREVELAQKYDMSRTPIREILWRLEQEDLVRIVPTRGAFVSDLTAKDIAEVFEIRLSLECPAARRAAKRMNDEYLTQLFEIKSQLETAATLQDSLTLFKADSQLHKLIFVVAGNTRAHRIMRNLMGQVLRVSLMSTPSPERINSAVNEGKRIVEALVEGNQDSAREAMRLHLDRTMEGLLPLSDIDRKFEEFMRSSIYI